MVSKRMLAGVHVVYVLATGVWPLVHRRSFEAVTGPKEDFWLARTVGGLTVAIGTTLGVAVVRQRRTPEARTLALASGAVYAIADLRAARTESLSYLGDLVAQAVLVPAWFGRWEGENRG